LPIWRLFDGLLAGRPFPTVVACLLVHLRRQCV